MKNTTPSPAGTRDPELTRSRILQAATELFVEQGYSAVSMSQVAKAAEVTKSLIHHHFGSKERLWEAVKERAFEHYFVEQMAMGERVGEPDADFLRDSVTAYFRFLKDNPTVVRLFAWAHLEEDAACGEMDRSLVEAGAKWIRQAQQRGVLRDDVNPTHVIASFVMTCTQWFEARSHHAHWPGIGDDEAFLEDYLKIFMEGMTPRQ